jgi:pyruvate kinase
MQRRSGREIGATFRTMTEPVEGTSSRVSTTYAALPNDVHNGDRILLDDGARELRVAAIEGHDVVTEVVHGGLLREHKGINLPGVQISTPTLTAKDRDGLASGCEPGVDFVAVSFVRMLNARTPLSAKKLSEKGHARARRRSIADSSWHGSSPRSSHTAARTPSPAICSARTS